MPKVLVPPFEFNAGPYGCLLLHGLTGSPFEMLSLGKVLYNNGFSVSGPRLPGHATDDWHDMAQTDWTDWYETVEGEYERLASHCQKVILVGFSIGGALCLHFALQRPKDVSALIVMATPLRIMNPIRHLAARLVVSLFPSKAYRPKTSSSIHDPEARATHLTSRHLAYAAVLSACDLVANLKRNLHRVVTPSLLTYSALDPVASPADGKYLYSHIGSVQRRLLWLSQSSHVVTRDYDKAVVQNEVLALACRVRDNTQPLIVE